jgi:6-phosphogluconate dehydrogenase
MLQAGQTTDETVEQLGGFPESGDIVNHGGNSFCKGGIRRARKLAEKCIRHVDCGTAGGAWGRTPSELPF